MRPAGVPARIRLELVRAWAITKKDARIYYFRPGTIMFGILFPLFLFFSFAVGRDLPPLLLIPGLIAITAFFSASSIGAMAVPTERRTRTYERMITAPISAVSILFGEIVGGMIYGILMTIPPLAVAVLWFGILPANPAGLAFAIALTSFLFSAMGIMFAALPTDNPGDVMIVLNFVRLPLIFVSGIFIPLEQLGAYAFVTSLSPLTYAQDLIRYTVTGESFFGPYVAIPVMLLFIGLFLGIGVHLHERNRRMA